MTNKGRQSLFRGVGESVKEWGSRRDRGHPIYQCNPGIDVRPCRNQLEFYCNLEVTGRPSPKGTLEVCGAASRFALAWNLVGDKEGAALKISVNFLT